MHDLPFTLPHRFSFKNIRDERAFIFSSRDNLEGSNGVHVSITWSCVSLLTAAVAPFAPNLRSPGSRLYCVIIYAQTLSSSSDSVTKSTSMICSASSYTVLVPVHVVACTRSSFVAMADFIASTTLLCALISPNCRKVCGVYRVTLLRNRVG